MLALSQKYSGQPFEQLLFPCNQEYSGQPFEQLLFPCNQFMNQEPGTAKEIIDFVKSKFGIVYGTAGFTIM
ncbi:hypothetical protein T484DRAFT_1787156 [Baffinella frigidus]|nr:hypothetical protein T484DRAFT_1787156 [Cryptophyta sp. CCMP2293]